MAAYEIWYILPGFPCKLLKLNVLYRGIKNANNNV